MAYSTVVCEHCGSKQVLMVGPEAREVQCSACAKMVQLKVEALMAPAVEVKKEEHKEKEVIPEAVSEGSSAPEPEKKRKRKAKKQDE